MSRPTRASSPPTRRVRHATAVALALLLAASVLAVPALEQQADGAGAPDLTLSVTEGPTGTAIEVAGEGCLLPDGTTPGDGVVVQLHPGFGESVAGTTIAVEGDGSFQGSLVVPAGTPAGTYQVGGECAYPQVHDLPVYEGPPFTVTGEGEDAPTPDDPLAQNQVAGTTGTGIEPYPSYDGQTTCNPSAKKGTTAFANKTLRKFTNTGTFGISRECTIGGTSEHKEGRAWDWKANAANRGQRRSVDQMLSWLLATDKSGNRHAMARRLGVMYIIWNRKMFRMYRAGDGWQPYGGSHPHTDHVHISFTRDGGHKRTSYWRLSKPPTWGGKGTPSGGGGTRPNDPPPTTGPPRATFRSAETKINGDHVPVTGDFDGNGRVDILWYGYLDEPDYIWFGETSGFFDGRKLRVGRPYEPYVGDFNGDGRDDVMWYGRKKDQDRIWWGRANRTFKVVHVTVARRYDPPFVGDFDGDGRDDVFWYGRRRWFDYLWWGKGNRTFAGSKIKINGGYDPPFAGDFDGDGRDDIFWYAPGRRKDYLWFGNANRTWTGRSQPVNGTYDPLVGDFNGDGREDVLWYQAGAGWDGIWLGGKDRSFTSQDVNVRGRYEPFVGDFDANGRDDVFWYAPGRGRDFMWWF